MNGELYSANLSALANQDGADTSPSELENRILSKWASALTGQNESGLDYRLWQIILRAKTGQELSGVSEQRIIWEVVNTFLIEPAPSGWNKYELLMWAVGSGGGPTPPPPEGCFTLIGEVDCFTLIGSADPFEFIQ